MGKYPHWQKLRNEDIPHAEKLLQSNEKKYVSACGRFLLRDQFETNIWLLKNRDEIQSVLINSRSTLMPVLCENLSIEDLRFFNKKNLFRNIHSIQGTVQDVLPFVKFAELKEKKVTETFNYHLMSTESKPDPKSYSLKKIPSNLILRVPSLSDLDALSPLQAAYEKEEVIPKGGIYNAKASRLNLANIISASRILIAELDGRIIGKINVNAVSFTRYQVGGVFVHPDFRGKGIARHMAGEFITSLVKEGKGVTLFVKKNNTPALKLYLRLGFTVKDDYRIVYY